MMTSQPSAPWYTEEIIIQKCEQCQLERRWRKSCLEADKQQFVDQCKQVRELIWSTKMDHFSSLIMENKSDHKVLLINSMNSLLHRRQEKHYPICSSTDELCNKFADFFSEQNLKIRHQLDAFQTDVSSNFQHFDDVNIDCKLTELLSASTEELPGLEKKISTKSCSSDLACACNLTIILRGRSAAHYSRVVNSSFE